MKQLWNKIWDSNTFGGIYVQALLSLVLFLVFGALLFLTFVPTVLMLILTSWLSTLGGAWWVLGVAGAVLAFVFTTSGIIWAVNKWAL
jgi:uncharacterized BrkB/YihY/UPF0761 family membrane protein